MPHAVRVDPVRWQTHPPLLTAGVMLNAVWLDITTSEIVTMEFYEDNCDDDFHFFTQVSIQWMKVLYQSSCCQLTPNVPHTFKQHSSCNALIPYRQQER